MNRKWRFPGQLALSIIGGVCVGHGIFHNSAAFVGLGVMFLFAFLGWGILQAMEMDLRTMRLIMLMQKERLIELENEIGGNKK